MSIDAEKSCHICGTNNPAHARFCNNCGAALAADTKDKPTRPQTYNPNFGETDLLESEAVWRSGIFVILVSIAAILAVCAAGLYFIAGELDRTQNETPMPGTDNQPLSETPDNQAIDVTLATNTPRPTMQLMTVTPAPPTPTETPTIGPCIIQVQPNDTLIGIIGRCGHRDLDVIDQVLEINNLSDPSALQLGQDIEIPRPTPTTDPNAQPSEDEGETTGSASTNGSFANLIFAEGADGLPTFTPTPSPTLPPGIQWYIVKPQENMITVALQFGASAEILSQLNPEITFSQCDFGEITGGASCTVFLYEGQQIRVPAPTPTATLSPTPSGSETPTPSPTATFNAPSLQSPGNRVLFGRNDLITLRWTATGSLAEDEAYRVFVRNLDTGVQYSQNVRESFIILPAEWQEQTGGHFDYEWYVTVIKLDDPANPTYRTETRIFTWEAANPSNSEG